ncbi:YdcF family protein [Clostridium sp. YIM B02505]|uniref:YdcF family protein n=1 Tax=Clostridium yunnanense TaxID=2800325 RepID=A0ABS1EJM8_9CLOT|nr:YdcF family protein [Clostridium yunnanense]MBK1809569.1 YdcF family protein [Clostridium yunnanense]
MKKRIKMFLSIIILVFIAVEIFIFWIPLFTTPDKSDAIVVLGCRIRGETPSAFLTARTEEAAELFKNGYGKYIIVSGGKGQGESISEAEGMKRILLSKGIDEDKIIMEDKSTSTAENIKFTSKIMQLNNFNSAVVVSNEFHLRRAQILCKRNKISATYKGVLVKAYVANEIYGAIREIPGIIKDLIVR